MLTPASGRARAASAASSEPGADTVAPADAQRGSRAPPAARRPLQRLGSGAAKTFFFFCVECSVGWRRGMGAAGFLAELSGGA